MSSSYEDASSTEQLPPGDHEIQTQHITSLPIATDPDNPLAPALKPSHWTDATFPMAGISQFSDLCSIDEEEIGSHLIDRSYSCTPDVPPRTDDMYILPDGVSCCSCTTAPPVPPKLDSDPLLSYEDDNSTSLSQGATTLPYGFLVPATSSRLCFSNALTQIDGSCNENATMCTLGTPGDSIRSAEQVGQSASNTTSKVADNTLNTQSLQNAQPTAYLDSPLVQNAMFTQEEPLPPPRPPKPFSMTMNKANNTKRPYPPPTSRMSTVQSNDTAPPPVLPKPRQPIATPQNTCDTTVPPPLLLKPHQHAPQNTCDTTLPPPLLPKYHRPTPQQNIDETLPPFLSKPHQSAPKPDDIIPPPLLPKPHQPTPQNTCDTTAPPPLFPQLVPQIIDDVPPSLLPKLQQPMPDVVPLPLVLKAPVHLHLAEQVVDKQLPPRYIRRHLVSSSGSAENEKSSVDQVEGTDEEDVFLKYNESYHTLTIHFHSNR